MICSGILQVTENRNSPVYSDFCRMTLRIGASGVAHSCSILFGMLSSPDAFVGFTFFSSFSNLFWSIFIWLIFWIDFVFVSGISPFDGFVKTDLNY